MTRLETRDITLATGLLGSLGAVLFGERHLPAHTFRSQSLLQR
jgi:hypothetical protein